MINMPKRKKKTNLTTGKKHMRMRGSRPGLVPQMNWNTEIFEHDESVDEEESDVEDEIIFQDGPIRNYPEDQEYGDDSSCLRLFATALSKIRDAGKYFVFVQFLTLICEDKFPFRSIIFSLFCEFVQWCSLTTTTNMRYSDTTKEFWWTGKMLFGSKFLRFMQGFKHKGAVTRGESEKGLYDPQKTKINFAVPNEAALNSYCPFEGVDKFENGVLPGPIDPVIKVYATAGEGTSHIMAFDGKKIIPNSANIDLLGCEDENTLQMQNTINEDEKCINHISEIIDIIQNTNTEQLGQLESADKLTLAGRIKTTFQHIGHRMQTIRDLKNKKAYALSKLEEKGTDAVNKDHFLMNHLKTFLHMCSNTMDDVKENLNDLCEIIAELNGASHNFVKDNKVSLHSQTNFAELMDPEDVAKSLNVEKSDIPTMYLKQRSPEWFEERKTVKVTGSTAFTAIGLDTLKQQKIYFDKVASGVETSNTAEQVSAMKHGTENEANAVATLVTKIMPVMYPKLTFFEEGAYKMTDGNSPDKPYLIISPDGSLREMHEDIRIIETSPKVGIEIKCPTDNVPFKSPVFYSPPRRYVPQCLLEQSVLKCDEQLLISWSQETTTVLKIPYDENLVADILSEVKTLYYTDVPHRPTKSSDKRKGLLEQIDNHINSCEFIGEFPSVTCMEEESTEFVTLPGEPFCMSRRLTSKSINLTSDSVCKTLLKSKSAIEKMKHLYQKKASEVVLFSLADTDRAWQKEIGHGMPVGYFTKGYSLTSECMRNIQTKMLKTCSESGIHIPCVTFDGQWYKLKDENAVGFPLTLFQAQRQHWNEICKLSKDQIVNALCASHTEVHVYTESNNGEGMTPKPTKFATSHDEKLQFPRGRLKQSSKVTQLKELHDTCDEDDTSSSHMDTENCVNDPSTSNDASGTDVETVGEDIQTFTYTLSDKDKICIRALLLKSSRKRNKFSTETLEHVDKLLDSADNMGKLTDPELKDIIDYINIQVKGNGREISNKGRKGKKINDLCKLFGVESTYLEIKRKTKRKVKSPKTLKELTKVMLKTFNKNVLDAIYASYKWPQAKQRWLSEVPVADTISVKDTGYSFHPLYSPEKVLENGKEMLQVQCLDGHHIRTNIRAKLCKDGTENLRKKAWSEVAKTKKTKLSLAMLEVNKDGKILDQQSDRYVRTMFCEDVEKELRHIGYDVESEFTKLFRQWHEAEDLPGILAVERCRRALALREWLLKEVCLEEFPPPGMYIKGFPKVTFEGLVCSIEAHIYMYELCMKGTYNWRSMTTLVAENLFGEVSEMESHNNGVPSGDSFRRNLAVMAGLNAVRLKPDRPFCMQTAKSRAYPVPKTEQISDAQTGGSTKDPYSIQKLTNICPRNHEFDLRETMGTGCVIGTVKGPFEVPRGVKPVRSHYAVDESKLLWSSRINEESDAF